MPKIMLRHVSAGHMLRHVLRAKELAQLWMFVVLLVFTQVRTLDGMSARGAQESTRSAPFLELSRNKLQSLRLRGGIGKMKVLHRGAASRPMTESAGHQNLAKAVADILGNDLLPSAPPSTVDASAQDNAPISRVGATVHEVRGRGGRRTVRGRGGAKSVETRWDLTDVKAFEQSQGQAAHALRGRKRGRGGAGVRGIKRAAVVAKPAQEDQTGGEAVQTPTRPIRLTRRSAKLMEAAASHTDDQHDVEKEAPQTQTQSSALKNVEAAQEATLPEMKDAPQHEDVFSHDSLESMEVLAEDADRSVEQPLPSPAPTTKAELPLPEPSPQPAREEIPAAGNSDVLKVSAEDAPRAEESSESAQGAQEGADPSRDIVPDFSETTQHDPQEELPVVDVPACNVQVLPLAVSPVLSPADPPLYLTPPASPIASASPRVHIVGAACLRAASRPRQPRSAARSSRRAEADLAPAHVTSPTGPGEAAAPEQRAEVDASASVLRLIAHRAKAAGVSEHLLRPLQSVTASTDEVRGSGGVARDTPAPPGAGEGVDEDGSLSVTSSSFSTSTPVGFGSEARGASQPDVSMSVTPTRLRASVHQKLPSPPGASHATREPWQPAESSMQERGEEDEEDSMGEGMDEEPGRWESGGTGEPEEEGEHVEAGGSAGCREVAAGAAGEDVAAAEEEELGEGDKSGSDGEESFDEERERAKIRAEVERTVREEAAAERARRAREEEAERRGEERVWEEAERELGERRRREEERQAAEARAEEEEVRREAEEQRAREAEERRREEEAAREEEEEERRVAAEARRRRREEEEGLWEGLALVRAAAAAGEVQRCVEGMEEVGRRVRALGGEEAVEGAAERMREAREAVEEAGEKERGRRVAAGEIERGRRLREESRWGEAMGSLRVGEAAARRVGAEGLVREAEAEMRRVQEGEARAVVGEAEGRVAAAERVVENLRRCVALAAAGEWLAQPPVVAAKL